MAQTGNVISHWHHLADDFNTSALDYYRAVETELAARQIPEIRVERIQWSERGLFTAKREYLRVARGRLTFDLCAAPYGTGFFFSWWFAEQSPLEALLTGCGILLALPIGFTIAVSIFGLGGGFIVFLIGLAVGWGALMNAAGTGTSVVDEGLAAIPGFGALYRRFIRPVTYYTEDTRLMFQESVHRAVMTVLREKRSAQGLRALSPAEETPQLSARTR